MLDSKKNRVYLIILPLLVLYLIYFYLDTNKKSKKYNFFKNSIKSKKIDFINLNKEIEIFLNENKIELVSISNSKKQIDLNVLIKDKQIGKLLNKLEYLNEYSNIKKLIIDKKEKSLINSLSLVVEFKKHYIKRKKQKVIKESKKKTKYRLQAIVHNHVLINSKWYTNNQKIDDFKIELISLNSLKLKSKTKEIVLKVYNEK